MNSRRCLCLAIVFILIALICSSAFAMDASTLHHGSKGEEVKKIQEALIVLGYLKGPADGVFGNKTEIAVRKFQRANKLKVDGLVGPKTKALILQRATEKLGTQTPTPTPTATPTPTPQVTPVPTASLSLFAGNYKTMRLNDTGSRVRILQKALIDLGYLSGKADGKFGQKTFAAVQLFQKANHLTQDGIAGEKTLKAIEKAAELGEKYAPTPEPTAVPTLTPTPVPVPIAGPKAPDGSTVKLLHWFNDIKSTLKSKDKLLLYDPVSGISWTLSVYSRGRHCDSEPLTLTDTNNMVKAFGGVNTWNQKAVLVRLPSGVWTIAATHDMPHMSGSIKDNGFDGHLCVHFLRNMDETKKNDPNYGVANQLTIRQFWKSLTGEDILY